MSVDVHVKGRHTEVAERFRAHAQEKLSRIERFDSKVMRIDVEVSEEHNPRLHDQCERVEITVVSRGPVVRAEACAVDRFTALDLALSKLEARLRRAADRRRVHHGGKTPVSVAVATSQLSRPAASVATIEDIAGPSGEIDGDGEDAASPVVIREKIHDAEPMTLDQAMYEMELVGHDFFLFVDATSRRPCVVYRRKGWDYGVIALQIAPDGAAGGGGRRGQD